MLASSLSQDFFELSVNGKISSVNGMNPEVKPKSPSPNGTKCAVNGIKYRAEWSKLHVQ